MWTTSAVGVQIRGRSCTAAAAERTLISPARGGGRPAACLTPAPCDLVRPPRVSEAQIVLEGRVAGVCPVGELATHAAIEVRILRTHWDEALLDANSRHHLDPDRWQPLLMSFLEFYTTGQRVRESRLATVF